MGFTGLIVALICVSGIIETQADERTVATNVGSIKGKTRDVSYDGEVKRIVDFYGIPFAEPPVGDLRFAKPVPKAIFKETFNAFEYGLPCIQVDLVISPMKAPAVTSEDCLSLNIHTPSVSYPSSYPVMVWIYGGGFIQGESKTYDGSILSAYGDVVVVTINYRLNVFGFLSLEDDTAPGNAGLWDQHLAIKWVKENIDSFGGDASRITIFGESAGGASVSLQTIYQGNEKLFQRAIPESGSANAFWVTGPPGSHTYKAKMLAILFNCSIPENNGGKEILTCLRDQKNATEIARVAGDNGMLWNPRLDEDFITSHALSSINWPRKGDDTSVAQVFDVIIGTTGMEGHFFMSTMFANLTAQMKEAPIPHAVVMFRELVKIVLSMAAFSDERLNDFAILQQKPETLDSEISGLEAILDGIVFLYTDTEHPNDKDCFLKQVSHFLTDTWFFIAAYKEVSSHSYMNKKTKTYQYEFNHNIPFKINTFTDDWLKGATHAMDVGYVFGFAKSLNELVDFTEAQALSQWPTSKLVMDYWTNFAKTGDPNSPRVVPEWKPYSHDNQDYLYFPLEGDSEGKQHLNSRRTAFWMDYVYKLVEYSKHVKSVDEEGEVKPESTRTVDEL